MRSRHTAVFMLISLVAPALTAAARGDALERLKAERLEAVHDSILVLKSRRQELPRGGPFRDYRANLHVHSAFSHDSRGKIDDIVAAAKAAGTQVLMFTEHPADTYDFFKDGHQGFNNGLLLIPGAEEHGLQCYPKASVVGSQSVAPKRPGTGIF